MPHVSGARLGSLVLGSTDPNRLAAWYQAAFAPGEELLDSVLRLNRGAFVFEQREDVAARAIQPGRVIINIQVDDFTVLETHLRALDLVWVRPVEQIPVGTIATLEDADGNYVNILEING